jgi:hypothetical protein
MLHVSDLKTSPARHLLQRGLRVAMAPIPQPSAGTMGKEIESNSKDGIFSNFTMNRE